MKVIISGGGTGGHVFPALAIADALQRQVKNIEILFVGAEGKLEMDKVPKAGYQIIGLPISGFNRKITFGNIIKNIKTLFNLFKSLRLSRKIIKDFQPDIAVGVGGYASGPVLRIAASNRVPIVVQEQNSFAGLTNKLLANKIAKVCVAYKNMDRFFPKDKIVLTGNPVRQNIWNNTITKEQAAEKLGFDASNPVVLVMGGSGGARSMNEGMLAGLDLIKANPDIQWLWQAGKFYLNEYKNSAVAKLENVQITDFIDGMDHAYALCEIVIGRAGALTIAEICALKKPSIMVPSPNVTEDHQTHNAMALVNENAAILVKDVDTKTDLVTKAIDLLKDKTLSNTLAENVGKMGNRNAADSIAKEILEVLSN